MGAPALTYEGDEAAPFVEASPAQYTVQTPGLGDDSQRARSLIFMAFGIIAATSLKLYHDGEDIDLFVCENGFIAINSPLTGARVGSLSTRTAHPEFLNRLQDILDAAGLKVKIKNPYEFMTKGEMMLHCCDQDRLRLEAPRSTSCDRFQRWNYKHCGRCIPCQVRRAAFQRWGILDATKYVFSDLVNRMKITLNLMTFGLRRRWQLSSKQLG